MNFFASRFKAVLDGDIYLEIYWRSQIGRRINRIQTHQIYLVLNHLFARIGMRMFVSCEETIYLGLAAVCATNKNCRKRKRRGYERIKVRKRRRQKGIWNWFT